MSSHPRSSVVRATRAWYPVCRADELHEQQPLATRIFGRPLVLFRTQQRHVVALDDRCPHRSVPLSLGRIVQGELECAYHGWRFGASGECMAIPGLCDGSPLRSRNANPYPTHEAQGLVWVWASTEHAPDRAPFAFPTFDASYHTVDIDVEAEGSLQQTIENALDVPHTAF